MKKLLITILKIAVFFIGWAVLSGIIGVPSDNPALWRFFAELIPLAVMILFTVVFWLIEKKTINIPIEENIGKGTLVGIVLGVVWIGVAASILIFSKQLEITGKNEVWSLWFWILSAFLNVIMQELLVRGYIYQLLKERYTLLQPLLSQQRFLHLCMEGIRSGSYPCHRCYYYVPFYHSAL